MRNILAGGVQRRGFASLPASHPVGGHAGRVPWVRSRGSRRPGEGPASRGPPGLSFLGCTGRVAEETHEKVLPSPLGRARGS